jgi:hypothetical protein
MVRKVRRLSRAWERVIWNVASEEIWGRVGDWDLPEVLDGINDET